MATKKKLLEAAAGSAGGAGGLDVSEVFSTYLYTGTGNTAPNTITNGIDLSAEGGLTWFKSRNYSSDHVLYDTERGVSTKLVTNSTAAQVFASGQGVTSFNSDGFTLTTGDSDYNASVPYASWTFRKAPKFFDVVTYTGTGSVQNISHNLGAVPACIFVKCTSTAKNWGVYHSGIGNTKYLQLNTTAEANINSGFWNNTTPTNTQFTLGTQSNVNASGETFVAYLFAHNDGDGDFGPTGDQDIIKCGSFTLGSNYEAEIDLGWEPQWLLTKKTNSTGGWYIHDNMRGMTYNNDGVWFYADTSDAEVKNTTGGRLRATGFNSNGQGSPNDQFIYIAIRRGPMAVPESATDVFGIATRDGTEPGFDSGFPVDFALTRTVNSADNWWAASRLNQGKYLQTNLTNAEASATSLQFDYMDGWNANAGVSSTLYSWMWKRAPSFFDVVCYTGNSSTNTLNHNLGVVPEMIWYKARGGVVNWRVHANITSSGYDRLVLDSFAAKIDTETYGTAKELVSQPTATQLVLGSGSGTNNSSSYNYIAYLFASLDGISKVGSYTGNGSSNGDSQTIDCGFSNGARFVLYKRTDNSSNWMLFDTERGIISGNDPALRVNTTAANYNGYDFIEPNSNGFNVLYQDVSSFFNPNISGASYIYYAIA